MTTAGSSKTREAGEKSQHFPRPTPKRTTNTPKPSACPRDLPREPSSFQLPTTTVMVCAVAKETVRTRFSTRTTTCFIKDPQTSSKMITCSLSRKTQIHLHPPRPRHHLQHHLRPNPRSAKNTPSRYAPISIPPTPHGKSSEGTGTRTTRKLLSVKNTPKQTSYTREKSACKKENSS